MRSIVLLFTVAWLAGCVSGPGVYPTMVDAAEVANQAGAGAGNESIFFNAVEHAPYEGAGNAAIRGQAFLRQQGGGVVTCAGAPVALMPDTTFFRAVVANMRLHIPFQLDPVAQAVVRRGQCDAQGNFEIAGVPPGRWIVTTAVSWRVGYRAQGGGLLRHVELPDQVVTQVLLTEPDFVAR